MFLNANRRSAVERLEETKAHYVKTERVLDCKQNFEYSSNLHVSTGPQIDVLLKGRVKSLYNCQNIIKYVHSINLTDNNAPSFANEYVPKTCGSFESRKSPELREHCSLQRKNQQLQHSYHDYSESTSVTPDSNLMPPSRGRRNLPQQPLPHTTYVNVNSCVQVSLNSGHFDGEKDGAYTNTEKLEVKFDHSDNEENSLEPSDESFTVDEDITEVDCKKQSSRTSDYVSRSSSFKCSVSSDRVKNLVKSFESKIAHVSPSTSVNSNSAEKTKSVTRSKSDVSCRFSKNITVAAEPESTTDAELERFFDTMGLDIKLFQTLTAPPKSPVHFFDSVSSENSETNLSSTGSDDSALEAPKEGLTNSDLRKHAPTETSIVEKNARVVKWLYNCHNAFKKNAS
ncbi:Protein FAM110C like protein [Argiope bruennichi]|uniref:Protein FAM110C like protein n=1 Tax=Argiope bruennichi TaxID=94029 RepID=A0A8T0F7P7_ARGBR|nr:Protein FAM110C like protein [Argiope bruennichi]